MSKDFVAMNELFLLPGCMVLGTVFTHDKSRQQKSFSLLLDRFPLFTLFLFVCGLVSLR